ncbi:MAG: sugar transferase [Bacteroidales bacterium]
MIRFFDIILSLIGLILLSPVFIFIAFWIIVDSPGGILYKQFRVGKNNHDFILYKFRTMAEGSDKKGLLTVGNNDMRITKAGKFLRKYKFDELPQLFNVLIGNMSFVGPRPEVRKYVNLYNAEQMDVLSVKPGITDFASIEFSNENEILSKSENPEKTYVEEILPLKLNLNLKYIKNQNLINYFKVIILTLRKISNP